MHIVNYAEDTVFSPLHFDYSVFEPSINEMLDKLPIEIWKNKNPEYYKEYGKHYALTHKEDIAEKHKIYYGENKAILNARCKAWVENNRDRNRAYQIQRYHKLKAKKLLEAQEGI